MSQQYPECEEEYNYWQNVEGEIEGEARYSEAEAQWEYEQSLKKPNWKEILQRK